MHFVYGLCDGNAIAAQREYRVCYPDRPRGLDQRLVESARWVKQSNAVGPALDTLQKVESGAIPCN